VLVVYDELDLPLGSLRLRQKGGSGGHNGMKSVIQHLGKDFPRLRLGIGRPPGRMEPAAYVLRDFSKEELTIVYELLDDAVSAIESFVQVGVDLTMTHHNKK
jgi:PTH1 family peptidyl-tRNA hydrolase